MLSRRELLGSAVAAGAMLASQKVVAQPSKRTIVDAQVHLWKAESEDWKWVPGMKPQMPEPLRSRSSWRSFDARPSTVKKIAHVVLTTQDVPPVVQWYRETLGLVQSEDIYSGAEANIIGSFNRCDRGDTYVDHHVFFCRDGKKNGLNHVSFEVQDFDDLMLGHDLLHSKKYKHMWGVGRHLLGAQVFDYWCDPWGRVHEHWTDSDRTNAQAESRTLPREAAYRSQWGPRAPQEFHGYATP